ncbi:MmcQ/YjbR family DNA-binding protein [soil metagenome]
MIDEHDVQRIALAFPGATEEGESRHFKANGKGFAWPYLERVEAKKPRVERRDIFVLRTSGEDVKLAMIESEPEKFFTTDHYNGYPAVMVRLELLDIEELTELLADAHAAAIQPKKRSTRPKSP